MLASTLGSAQRFKKRERTQNWAYEEKRFLLELCRKDMHIIENKRLDSALTSLKNRAWKIIHQQFAIAFGTDRNCNRLKEQWRRMKGRVVVFLHHDWFSFIHTFNFIQVCLLGMSTHE